MKKIFIFLGLLALYYLAGVENLWLGVVLAIASFSLGHSLSQKEAYDEAFAKGIEIGNESGKRSEAGRLFEKMLSASGGMEFLKRRQSFSFNLFVRVDEERGPAEIYVWKSARPTNGCYENGRVAINLFDD